jgi:hypothetical protein
MYPVDTMDSIIRQELNERAMERITPNQVLDSINDGYKEVSSRAFCVEHEDLVSTVSGERLVKFSGNRVNKITYQQALVKVTPESFGVVPLKGDAPQFWFQWGQYVVLDPVPDKAYQLKLYVSDYPLEGMERDLIIFTDTSAQVFLDTGREWQREDMNDYPSDMPAEFHECIADFALYALSVRLKKWGQVSYHYNNYIANLSTRKTEYINRKAEARGDRWLP